MKGLRHIRACTGRRIQADRHDERPVAGHHVSALIRKIPLKPEIALLPRRGVRRNDGDKERAVADLAPDLLIPRVPDAQLALVEPDFYSRRPERLADPLDLNGVLRGVTQEHRPGLRADAVR